jgi:hypothetical protein
MFLKKVQQLHIFIHPSSVNSFLKILHIMTHT